MTAGRRCRPETAVAGHSRNEERTRRAGRATVAVPLFSTREEQAHDDKFG
jgi:hypothetical protein